ncbi:MAG: transglycosylase SLT domain-containing protein [Calditrichaceae bacterium]
MYQDKDKKVTQTPKILLVILILFVSQLSQGNNPDPIFSSSKYKSYHTAESLYTIGDFEAALQNFENSSVQKVADRNPETQFKIAYSFYKTGKYDSSSVLFYKLYTEHQFLPKYSSYFYTKSQWKLDPDKGIKEAVSYVKKYNKHALADSLLIPISDAYFEQGEFKKARKFYQLIQKQKLSREVTVYARIQAAYCLYYSNSKKQALNEFYQIIRRYPGEKETALLVENLRRDEPEFYEENFFKFVDVYFYNEQYTTLRLVLEKYIKIENDKANIERARYYLTKLYLAQNRYKTALYGFQGMLSKLKNEKLEPHIRLNIARAHYKIGNKRNAIDAYLDYAHRYPRRRIAPETVWKAAWIYEELKDLENALKTYRDLRQHWKKSPYAREAYFREGFTLFRLGRIEDADLIFRIISLKRWPDVDVNRAQYWSSLCKEIQHDYKAAKQLRLELAKHLWDDYYTMKSYLMHKAEIDSTLDIANDFKNSSESFEYYGQGMANLLSHFDEAFLVRDLLGESYGFAALSDIKLSARSKHDWMTLAEIYKKFGEYNKAFRLYDYINYKFFGNLNYTEKPFILKERFPFYFDDIVEKYAQRYNIEQEFILGLIKQESVYDPRAHSPANAYGLMQLMPLTADDMARIARMRIKNNELLFNPEINIHLGSLYLKQLDKQFDGYKESMLAAYNAGPHRVQRWNKIEGSENVDVFIENIEFSETRDYVRQVMKNYWAYKLLGNNFNIDQDEIRYGVTMPELKRMAKR